MMKATQTTLLVLCLGLARLSGAAAIDGAAISPASTPAGQAAIVTVTAQITDPTVLAGSVNLQQLDAQGRVLSVIGSLTDDGTGGDAVANDHIFTIQFTVLQQQPGTQTYRVSAGPAGSLVRIFSTPLTFTVAGAVPTGIVITQPANLTYSGISPIVVAGTVGDPGATVTVNGIAAAKSGTSFQASIPLQEGTNPITAVATNSNSTTSTASIEVTLDTTAPHVTIDAPANNSTTTEATVTVTGIVNDIVLGSVNGTDATVTVNGMPAQVANRHYSVSNVPLALGANTIQAVAVDKTGNSATVTAQVTRQAAGPQFIKLVSGNNQSGAVTSTLPAPLVVQLMNNGAPAANVPVIFKVVNNDASLQPGVAGAQLIAVNTDANGNAQATLTLGRRAGAGINSVQAYATGFQGMAVFSATGVPQAAARVLVDSGNNQFGAIGQNLALPLVAVVLDALNNRLGGVPVTFTVTQGGGSFAGQTSLQATSDESGRVSANFTLGPQPGNAGNVVQVSFLNNPSLPGVFTATGKVPGNPAQTAITGFVTDNTGAPISGVTMRLFLANQAGSNNQPAPAANPVATDTNGFFQISPAPVGFFKLMADGSTATQSGKLYPTLEYDIVSVAGQNNTVGTPIFLPVLDPLAKLCVTPTTGGILTIPSVPGFALNVQPGSATFPGGSRSGCVSVSAVHPDRMPMEPPAGQQPRFVVTIQPIGTIFNPPAPITAPNLEGLPPGTKIEASSYDHDLSAFVAIGTATVSPDGSVISSDPGVGILKAGWDFFGLGGVPMNVTSLSVKIVSVKGVGN